MAAPEPIHYDEETEGHGPSEGALLRGACRGSRDGHRQDKLYGVMGWVAETQDPTVPKCQDECNRAQSCLASLQGLSYPALLAEGIMREEALDRC